MTPFLESRLPPGDNSGMIAEIEKLNDSQLIDLERWITNKEEKIGRVELSEVNKRTDGFSASIRQGMTFLDN